MSNYIRIDKTDSANGPGVRVVLWMAGCNHQCPGCHNPETWDPDVGQPFTDATMDELIEDLSKSYIRGLTLSGGDPLYPDNRETTLAIVKKCKEKLPNKDIWMWTGYLWEQVQDLEIMNYVDVLVDGPFIMAEKDISLPYAGSRNQRVIDVQKFKRNEKTMEAFTDTMVKFMNGKITEDECSAKMKDLGSFDLSGYSNEK